MRGDPIVFLAGIHVGCFELFGTERVRAIRDLKGKPSAFQHWAPRTTFSSQALPPMWGWIPSKDIHWVTHPSADSMQLLADGQIDAFRLPAGTAGAPGEADRSRACGRQQHARTALVPVLLLHGGREPRVRPEASGGHQAGAARHSESDRHLCAGTRTGRPASRGQGLYPALRLRPPNPEGDPLWQVAGVRP